MVRTFTKYPSNYVKSSKKVDDGKEYEVLNIITDEQSIVKAKSYKDAATTVAGRPVTPAGVYEARYVVYKKGENKPYNFKWLRKDNYNYNIISVYYKRWA